MIKASDLRKGKTIIWDGDPQVVHVFQHVVKGKGASFMQVKLKNLKNGRIVDVRFRMDEKVEVPFIESKSFEYLYKEGGGYVVMDTETFDQITVPEDVVGDGALFLKPNEKISCQFLDGQMISFELPFVVELEIAETTPSIKGATATNQLKEAVMETGAKVRVPPFLCTGDRIRVDTRTGEYIERAK